MSYGFLPPLTNGTSKSTAISLSNGSNGQPVEWRRPNHFSITVYRNGDEYDPGTKIGVTRIQMPHWISLLDYLTMRLQLVDGSVQHIYTMDGEEVRHFRQFDHNGKYVASHGKYRRRNYGGNKAKKPPFGVQTALYEDNNDAGRLGIYSDEGLRNYLRQRDFEPTLGDIWDNTHFDLKGKRDRMSRNQEEAEYVKEIRNGSYATNGKSGPPRRFSRETRTEDLAATIMGRLGRSQSVNGRQQPRASGLVDGTQIETNSAEAELVGREARAIAAAAGLYQLKKSESEQDFRAISGGGGGIRRAGGGAAAGIKAKNRGAGGEPRAYRQNAGRTPAARNGVGAGYDQQNVNDTYDIFEMEDGRTTMTNGKSGARSRASVNNKKGVSRMAAAGGRSLSTSRRTVEEAETVAEAEIEGTMEQAEEELIERVMEDTGASRREAEEAVEEVAENMLEQQREENEIIDQEGLEELALVGNIANSNGYLEYTTEKSPRWATELTTAVRELASEVHHLHPPRTAEMTRTHHAGKKKSKK